MIDLDAEEVVPLSAAAASFPGGGVHVCTLHRYRLTGIRGVKLDAIRIGGRWATSKEAMMRFVDQLNSNPVAACSRHVSDAMSDPQEIDRQLDAANL